MKQLVRTFLAPLASIAIFMLGNGFFVSFISLKLAMLQYGALTIGIINSSYYLGLLLGALWVERTIRRVGHIRAFCAFGSTAIVTTLAMAPYVNSVWWFLMRFTAGFALAGLYVVIESWMLHKSSNKTRARALCLYMIAFYLFQGLSQYLLQFINYQTLEPYVLASMLTALSMLPVSLTRTTGPQVREPTLKKLGAFIRESPFGLSGCFIAGMLLGAIYSFMPVVAQQRQLDVSTIMSITIIGGMVLQWPIGRLSEQFDRHLVILGVTFAVFFPATAFMFTGFETISAAILGFLLGGLTFSLYPLSISHVGDRVEEHNMTALACVLLFVYGLGSFLGPLMAPLLMDKERTDGLFLFMILGALFLLVVGLFAFFTKEEIPLEEQGDFVMIPRSSSLLIEAVEE